MVLFYVLKKTADEGINKHKAYRSTLLPYVKIDLIHILFQIQDFADIFIDRHCFRLLFVHVWHGDIVKWRPGFTKIIKATRS